MASNGTHFKVKLIVYNSSLSEETVAARTMSKNGEDAEFNRNAKLKSGVHDVVFQNQTQPRNKEQEQEVLEWIAGVLGEKLPPGAYEDVLKDGVVLCKLANKLAPGSVKKIQERGTNFQLMENIQRFQAAIKKYGVPEEEIFQTADLFERRNIPQVTLCLYSLGRITQKHPEFTGPSLGPKMAEKNERTFTEEQLRANEGQLNLQMGFNKGASQSGHGGFGNTRHM